tara:strand:+ start:185 stop:448 length:264 start_codon:yes stop_codon:yes gene_type:complete
MSKLTILEKFEKLEESLHTAEAVIQQLENKDNLYSNKYELESLDEYDKEEIDSLLFTLNRTFDRLSSEYFLNCNHRQYRPEMLEEQA